MLKGNHRPQMVSFMLKPMIPNVAAASFTSNVISTNQLRLFLSTPSPSGRRGGLHDNIPVPFIPPPPKRCPGPKLAFFFFANNCPATLLLFFFSYKNLSFCPVLSSAFLLARWYPSWFMNHLIKPIWSSSLLDGVLSLTMQFLFSFFFLTETFLLFLLPHGLKFDPDF